MFIVKNNNRWTSQTNWFLENHSDPYLVMPLFSPGHRKISEKKYLHFREYICAGFFFNSKCHCSAPKRKVQKADLTFEVNWNRASDFCGKIFGLHNCRRQHKRIFVGVSTQSFFKSAPHLKCTFNILGFLDWVACVSSGRQVWDYIPPILRMRSFILPPAQQFPQF